MSRPRPKACCALCDWSRMVAQVDDLYCARWGQYKRREDVCRVFFGRMSGRPRSGGEA